MLPSLASKQPLEDNLFLIFWEQTDVIRTDIGSNAVTNSDSADGSPSLCCSFTLSSEEEVSQLAAPFSSAACEMDSVPSSLVTEYLDLTLHRCISITFQFCKSNCTSLKAPFFIQFSFTATFSVHHYWENVALRLNSYICINDKYQTAYQQRYITDTVLVCAANDTLCCNKK